MTEQELRELVREAVARHTGREPASAAVTGVAPHPSHGLLPLAPGGDGSGACIIEPSVQCTHCGYCVSYGH